MPYDLQNRRVLVTGSSRGLGALIAEKFAHVGAHVAVNYVAKRERAEEVAARIKEVGKGKVVIVGGDAGVEADCRRMVQETVEGLGGVDVIVGNAGWTKFSTFGDLDALSEEDWDKCWAVNVKGQMFLLRAALPHFNANPDGGVFLITSSIAGMAPSGSSMAYSVSKAAGLHLMKCLAQTQGPKVRVNAVSPGLLLTEWGENFSPEVIKAMKDKAALKQETNLDDCAESFLAAARNASLTGVNIRVDSGVMTL
ncbi:MAG: hypothetical protein M1833_006121 [Piccolia ochrophora]|nr:MAG: hypothetical protein M1833_006121 [Piccolia ochrophora]